MKKILFKSGSTMMGGLEKVQIEYINFLLNQEKYEIKVVIENDNGEDNILEKYINTKVIYLKNYEYKKKILRIREQRNKNILSKLKYNIALIKEKKYADNIFLRIYNEFEPNIVIDFDSSLTKIIKKLKKSKNFIWLHSSIEKWKKKKSKIRRFIDRLVYYNKIICICEEMRDDLLKLDSNLKDKVEYIYNPIDFQKIKELAEEKFSGTDIVLAKQKFLLTIARFDCIPKDFETLFKAFDLAKEKGYNGKLYVVGDGPDREKVESFKNKSKFKNEIFLLGRKENPYNWLKKADKFVLSSRYEGFGLVLLEALVLEKNVISSDCKTGPKEILKNNRGKLFPVGDYRKLGEFILKENLFKDEKINLNDFSSENIFSKLIAVLEE